MADPQKILYAGRFAGFEGGIERYEYGTAQLLRKNGFQVFCAYQEKGRNFQEFSAGFDGMIPLEQLAEQTDNFALVAVHKLTDTKWLEYFLSHYGENLVLFVHDHDLYCPRRHYYVPVGRKNCHLAYSPFRCALCALAVNPRSFENGLAGKLRQLCHSFPKNLSLFRKFPKAVVLSQFMKGTLLRNGFSEEKIQVIPPFVISSGEPRKKSPSNPLQLLFMGQLIRGKGVDLLLQALAQVQGDFRCVIAGDGNDRAWLESLSAELGLAEKVQFPGWVLHPEKLYEQCDVLLFPSRWQEPFGLTGLEAAALGIPVIAFEVGGCSEYVIPDKNGFLVPPGNVEQFAEKINQLIQHPEQIQPLGEAGRQLAQEKFSPQLFLSHFSCLLS